MQKNQPDEIRSLIISLVVSVALFAFQLTVYFLSNILIVLAGAFDTLSDILISAFLLGSIFWSRKPADKIHMFGHGRIQNVASLVTATIFIFFLSIETFRAALPKIFQNDIGEIHNINLALIVTLTAIFIYAIPLLNILKLKERGPALKAQLYALIEMEIAFTASFFSLILVGRGYRIADSITSIFIGIIIAFTGIKLLIDSAQYLIGRAPPKEYLDRIVLTASSVEGVLGVHNLAAEYVGPGTVHTGFHIVVTPGITIEEADRIAHEVRERVSNETGCSYCLIHVDPKTDINSEQAVI